MRESIQYALDHREEALNYAMQFARDMEPATGREIRGHVREPLHRGLRGNRARKPRRNCWTMGFEAGLIPHRVRT